MKKHKDLIKSLKKVQKRMQEQYEDFKSNPQISMNQDLYVIGHFETLEAVSIEIGKLIEKYDEDVKVPKE